MLPPSGGLNGPPEGTGPPKRTPRRKDGQGVMIKLTKIKSKERILVNHNQIQHIEFIPETKVVMMNRDYYLVEETGEEIIQKIAEYTAKVMDIHREITLVDKR
jgi:flagellar protein FlbD